MSGKEATEKNLTTGIPNPTSQKGLRCIVLAAGSSDGWIHSATRVYVRGKKNPEYRDYDYHEVRNICTYTILIINYFFKIFVPKFLKISHTHGSQLSGANQKVAKKSFYRLNF